MDKKNEVSCSLREICDELGVSIYSIGKKTGVNNNQIYPYLTKGKTPNLVTALKIANGLGVTVDDIWKLNK